MKVSWNPIVHFVQEPRKTWLRRLLFHLHLWSGLLVGVIATVVGLTGSAIVFRQEIEHALESRLAYVQPGAQRISLQAMQESLRAAYPDWRPTWADLRIEADNRAQMFALESGAAGREKTYWYGYVNPYTGETLGVRSRDKSATWMNWFADLHINLLAGETGYLVNGVGAALLLLLCVSGVVIWYPGRGRIRRSLTLTKSAGWKRRNWEIHNLTGFTVSLALGAVAFTGVFFVFYEPLEKATYVIFSASKPSEPKSVSRGRPAAFMIDDLARRAESLVSNGRAVFISFPRGADDAIGVSLRTPGDPSDYGGSSVWFDQYDGKLLRVDDLRRQSGAAWLVNLIGPVHFGTFGGTPTRILWIFLGVAPGALFFSGFAMWWNRVIVRRLRARAAAAPATFPT
jgi:uncharacterized iron-regulated membrane protein